MREEEVLRMKKSFQLIKNCNFPHKKHSIVSFTSPFATLIFTVGTREGCWIELCLLNISGSQTIGFLGIPSVRTLIKKRVKISAMKYKLNRQKFILFNNAYMLYRCYLKTGNILQQQFMDLPAQLLAVCSAYHILEPPE